MLDIQVVLLCGGKGTRLEGMDLPKPMCTVRARPLIYHVLEALPKEIKTITFFYSEALDRVQFDRFIRHSCNNLQEFRFQKISLETRGPVETAYVGLHNTSLDEDKPVLFIDNDTINTFNPTKINREYLSIGTFHTLDRTKPYSFLKTDPTGTRVLDIKEKDGISNTYSTGLYYFPTVKLFRELSDTLFRTQSTRKEYFLSDMYALAIEQGNTVYTFPCEASVGLGTHADIMENIHKVKHYPMRICFDIDNTLITFSEKVGTVDGLEPIPGMIGLVRKLHKDGHTIVLQTARGMKSCSANLGHVGKRAMMNVFRVLEQFDVPYDEIYFGKPYADLYVDDKAWNQYSNPLFSSFMFNYSKDTSVLHIPKGCSNNENTLWRKEGRLVKEGPRSSLEGEIYFYKLIQGTSLQGICPAYYSESHAMDRSFLTLEFLNGVSVSRLFRNGLLTKHMLGAVVDIIKTLHSTVIKNDNPLTKNDIIMNYLGKLNERAQSHPNYRLERIEEVLEIINAHITRYINSSDFAITDVIHGDPWFDNMIYSYENQSVKLLDMKGKIGAIFTLKGDKMVDYAKLYQSILGFDYALHADKYPPEYESNCRQWLTEHLSFSLEDPVFEAVTACCILKTFFYFSKTEPIESIYRSLGKLRLFSGILNQ